MPWTGGINVRIGSTLRTEYSYELYFEKALQEIKSIRAPHSKKADMDDLEWNEVRQQQLFYFGDRNFEKHAKVVIGAKWISIKCVQNIIMGISKVRGVHFSEITDNSPLDSRFNHRFSIKDVKEKEIFFFCEIANGPLWINFEKEAPRVEEFLKKHNAIRCKYIFLMYDKAYLQIIGHNEDRLDQARGNNFYAIKWFFERYFGIEEQNCFEVALKRYVKKVEEYLGYCTIKTLTPGALVNFKKIMENKLLEHPYVELVNLEQRNKKNRRLYLGETEYQEIVNQFVRRNTYLIILGKNDFAESLMTAEWLYDVMQTARAIDLTAIGMGYFKSVEQLLFDLICLHKGNGRKIKLKNSSKELVELNDANIAEDVIDTTLGSMAVFYKHNLDILRSDLRQTTKEYVNEMIFKYAELRNGYLHKHNIYEWGKIEEIRTTTFNLIFLLLGAQQLSTQDMKTLGRADENIYTDFYRLCEYTNYHCDEIFFVEWNNGKGGLYISCCDLNVTNTQNGEVLYSGVYLRDLGDTGRKYRFTEKTVPKEIWLAKLNYGTGNSVYIVPQKIKKIYEQGKFLCPNIARDNEFDY